MTDIKLLPLSEEYIEIVRSWRNSKEISQYMFTDDYITEENQLKWFQKVNNDHSQRYWLIEYGTVKVGLVSLNNINYDFKSCYWAFYLDRRGILNNLDRTVIAKSNISGKVEYTLLKIVFDELQMNKLLCDVLVENMAVINMHEKWGFRREAYFREHIIKNNVFHDVVTLAMLKQEWDLLKEPFYKKIYNSK